MQALAASSGSVVGRLPASQTAILVFSSRYGMLASYHRQYGTFSDPQPTPYLDLLEPKFCTGAWSIRRFEQEGFYCVLQGIAGPPAADLRTILLSNSEMADLCIKNGSPEDWYRRLEEGWRPGQRSPVVAISQPPGAVQLRTGTTGD